MIETVNRYMPHLQPTIRDPVTPKSDERQHFVEDYPDWAWSAWFQSQFLVSASNALAALRCGGRWTADDVPDRVSLPDGVDEQEVLEFLLLSILEQTPNVVSAALATAYDDALAALTLEHFGDRGYWRPRQRRWVELFAAIAGMRPRHGGVGKTEVRDPHERVCLDLEDLTRDGEEIIELEVQHGQPSASMLSSWA